MDPKKFKRLKDLFARLDLKLKEDMEIAGRPRPSCTVHDTIRVRRHPEKCSFGGCKQTARFSCPYCFRVFCDLKDHVMSEEHERECRAYAKRVIKPKMIEFCASRAIEAGQLLQEDLALLEFPNYNYGHPVFHEMQNENVLIDIAGFLDGKTAIDRYNGNGNGLDIIQGSPICFGCHSKRREFNLLCKECGVPLCSEKCELESRHRDNECRVISSLSMNIWNCHPSAFAFHLDIATVRAIISYNNVKTGARYKWIDLVALPRFVNFKNGRNYHMIFGNASLETILPISIAYAKNEYIISNLACVICAFSDIYPWNLACCAIYPDLVSLKQSCTPNVQFQLVTPRPKKQDENRQEQEHGDAQKIAQKRRISSVALISTRRIAAGVPLTADFCFKSTTGYLERRTLLRRKYIFKCDCSLCLDPTDGRSFSNAIKCPNEKCILGYMLPTDLTKPERSAWCCNFCGLCNLSGGQVVAVFVRAARELKAISSEAIEQLEDFQHRLSKIFHPNHYIITAGKRKMLQCKEKYMLNGSAMMLLSVSTTGDHIVFRYDEVEFLIENYERKREYCYTVLRHLNRSSAGINYKRAFVLRELFFTNFLILLWETKLAKFTCNNSLVALPAGIRRFREEIVREMGMLNESCTIIMKCYEPHTEEYQLAAKSLPMVRNMRSAVEEIWRQGSYMTINLLRKFLFCVAQAMVEVEGGVPAPDEESLLLYV